MIVYKKEEPRLVSTLTNIITLAVPSGGYIYVDKVTYEQAAILNAKYGADMNGLAQLVGSVNHTEEIKIFYKEMPEPVRVLAPFIGILDNTVKFSGELEEIVGCVHVMSESLNFNRYIKMPIEVRRNVSFSDHIRVEYAPTWEKFFMEAVDYNKLIELFKQNGTFYVNPVSAQPIAPQPVVIQQPVYQQPAPAPVAPPTPPPTPVPPPVQIFNTPSTPPTPAVSKPAVPNIFETSAIKLSDETKDDPALQAIASNPALMQELFGEEDEESEEFKKRMEELKAMDNMPKAAAKNPHRGPDIPEAKSGKDLIDDWDSL